MATVDTIARRALGAVGPVDMDGLVQAYEWVNNRYAEVCAQVRQRHLRRAGSTTIAAPVTTGTVSVSRGAREVVGVGTNWTSAMVGRWFRAGQGWYEVVGVPAPTSLLLGTAYGEVDVAAGGYTLVQRYVVLPPETRFATSWVLGRRWELLDEVSLRALDEQLAPGRFYLTTLGAGGGYVAHVGFDAGRNGHVYEVYPYSTLDESLHFVWWSIPPRLAPEADLPPTIDEFVLTEGVLVDVYRFHMAKAWHAGRSDIGGSWRNEMRAQETVWRQYLMAYATKADRGADDMEWLFRTVGAPLRRMQEVRSARDHIIVQGNRP